MAALGRPFDYTVPERWLDQVAVGARVRIPLHGRRVAGWVVDADVAEPPPGVALRPLAGVSGLGPTPEVLETAEWAAWRWAGPVSTLLRAASPPRNVWSLPVPPASDHASVPGAGSMPAGLPEPAHWEPGQAKLLRLPPVADPLPVVLAALSLGRPGTVLVLVPEIGWAERLATRLRRRGVPVAAGWEEAAAGWPVVVGPRTAAWAPVPTLAAAVVFDAHDEAYGSGWPGFHAAEVAVRRAAHHHAPCVLASPCPTPVQVDRYRVHAPTRVAERDGWPVVTVVDRRSADPRSGLYSEELVRLARRMLAAADGRLVCVLNRTGRARLLACAACGELARCERCGRPVEQQGDRFHCRGCDTERPVVCASCGATRPKVLRIGVSRAREELEALLGEPVAEMAGPRPRTGDRPASDDPGDGWPDAAVRVVVGTEAVLHRIRRAGAVAFLDFDQHLLAPRFVAAEQALALLCRAGRLVGGRAAARGTVLVQTRLPQDPVLEAAVHGEPARSTDHELSIRRQLGLPPASALALVVGAPGDPAPPLGDPPGVELAEIDGGRWLARAPDHATLCDALAAMVRGPGSPRVTVDPIDV